MKTRSETASRDSGCRAGRRAAAVSCADVAGVDAARAEQPEVQPDRARARPAVEREGDRPVGARGCVDDVGRDAQLGLGLVALEDAVLEDLLAQHDASGGRGVAQRAATDLRVCRVVTRSSFGGTGGGSAFGLAPAGVARRQRGRLGWRGGRGGGLWGLVGHGRHPSAGRWAPARTMCEVRLISANVNGIRAAARRGGTGVAGRAAARRAVPARGAGDRRAAPRCAGAGRVR